MSKSELPKVIGDVNAPAASAIDIVAAAVAAHAEKTKAPSAEKIKAPPVAPPKVQLLVTDRFAINPGSGMLVFKRGDVLDQGSFEPRVWGDILELLNKKVVVR